MCAAELVQYFVLLLSGLVSHIRQPATVCADRADHADRADRASCLPVVENKVQTRCFGVSGALLPLSDTTMLQLLHYMQTFRLTTLKLFSQSLSNLEKMIKE